MDGLSSGQSLSGKCSRNLQEASQLTRSSSYQVSSTLDLLHRVMQPKPIELDFSQLSKGIDNYHVDVVLSQTFVNASRHLIESAVRKIVSGAKITDSDLVDGFRRSYVDMLSTTVHRAKTDLTPAQISILQFASTKFLLQEIRRQLASIAQRVEETLAQQQYSGARDLLATQARLFWLRQHQDEFLYKSNRFIFRLLQRDEANQLGPLRSQYLKGAFPEAVDVMFNPLLAAASPVYPRLLVECYSLWPVASINQTTEALEAVLHRQFPHLTMEPLRRFDRYVTVQSEIFDELGGLFAAQPLLGPAENQRDSLRETFCWLEQPGNVRLLFDARLHQKTAREVRQEQGIRAAWRFKSDVRKLLKFAAQLRKVFGTDADFRVMLASYQLRHAWSELDNELIEIEQACKYVAGIDANKIAARVSIQEKGAFELLKRLDELARDNAMRFKDEVEELVLKCLTDYFRYRLHLRNYQLAHRIFNRLNVISDPEQAHLSRVNGHLYELLGNAEAAAANGDEPLIVHHAILKADVRGSTTVTQELIRNRLNPAAYFSTRFFNPINQLLSVYGAVKVFVEGDAVILSINEHNKVPEQWYSVSRACGIAKDILDIVNSKNAHSKQTQLPVLEIGIGIAYSNDKPLFLYDDERPIMISSAIGRADRLSSCSWKLRERYDDGLFNVEVFEISQQDRHGGDKGQKDIRFNVNGILLANEGFAKLQSEISLRRLRVRLKDGTHTMFVGKFPDVAGKVRELVIREGTVLIWKNDAVLPTTSSGEVFYEVLPNSKIASQVLQIARDLGH